MEEMKILVLRGHTSPETAFVVEDYPYGFRLRCKIRYWLEWKKGKGFRFWRQTTNPKVTLPSTETDAAGRLIPRHPWNKPKASTYVHGGAYMYISESDGHVHWACERFGAGVAALEAFSHDGFTSMPEEAKEEFNRFLEISRRYEANKGKGDDYRVAAFKAVRGIE